MRRRDFLKASTLCVADAVSRPVRASSLDPLPIIDTHIHLYDPSRAGGVPWPEKTDSILYKPTLPDRFRTVTKGLGVQGAIAIECSPWENDNDWLLETAGKDPVIVGVIGDLTPGSSTFGKSLDRLSRNPLFRGIRYGNLWDRKLSVDIDKPGFIEDLKVLCDAKLTLDSANPDAELISGLVRIKDKVPELTIAIDHLPNSTIPTEVTAVREYNANLQRLRECTRVYVKLSEIPARMNGKVSLELGFYKQKLDTIWDLFGDNRILFGSDWPNSDHLANYAQTLGLVRQYVLAKEKSVKERFFWRNSIAAYGWQPRLPNQSLS